MQGDFEAGPGPNFWLYVNAKGGVEDEGDFLADDGRIKIAKLKSFKGSQVYALTAEQFAAAKALTIWCEKFQPIHRLRRLAFGGDLMLRAAFGI